MNIRMLSRNVYVYVAVFVLFVVFASSIASAWTPPPASPPNSNVAAPINVSSTAQSKNGDLLLSGLGSGVGRYFNFDYTVGGTSGTGLSGYGMRDNAGTMEFKNLGGTGGTSGWKSLQTIVNEYIALGGAWATNGTSIYYNGGNVGIGTASPGFQLEVSKSQAAPTIARVTNSSTASGAQSRLDVVGGSPNNYGIFNVSESGTGANWAALAIGDGPAAFYIQAGATATNHPIYFYQGATQRAAIDASGNLTSAREIISTLGTGSGQFRMISGAYGAFWRNDGANTYLLFTNANDQYGSWNALRPVAFSNTTGNAVFGSSVTATAFIYSSDARLKNIIGPIKNALAKVLSLSGVDFTWKSGPQEGKKDIGVIAQDVEKVAPEAVHTDEKGMLSVDYPRLVPLLINAIKEQQVEIDALKQEVGALKGAQ